MFIEIRGVDNNNKGSELMMLTILHKFRETLSDPFFVMSASKFNPPDKFKKYGVYVKKDFSQLSFFKKFVIAFIPSYFLRHYLNYIDKKKIDVVLDASGFAFGDIWGIQNASRLRDQILDWKLKGKKIILLPQAFGPFSSEGIASVMKIILCNADLVFSRDQISFEYLKDLNSNTENIFLAPDFTNLINGTVPLTFDNSKFQVAIIVNNKMIVSVGPEGKAAYLGLIQKIVLLIENAGFTPFFLLHEIKMDRPVAEAINEILSKKLVIIEEDNALHIKGIIGKCKAVFSSRFHGLVSCLSQGIPCLATGWSHKYQMLLRDYNYEEGMVDINSSDVILSKKINAILKSPSREAIISNLKNMSTIQKDLSEKMLQKVLVYINSN